MTLRATLIQTAIDLVTRLIIEARSDRDAEAIVHQLRALGQVPRADVDAIEAAAREALSTLADQWEGALAGLARGPLDGGD